MTLQQSGGTLQVPQNLALNTRQRMDCQMILPKEDNVQDRDTLTNPALIW